jgi:NAD(P)-dependent dehydrogenase (short-subunit alcohol dehydrogenase family)
MGSVKDKVVLITGGARGIGAETARQLHARGAKVVIFDLDESALHDLPSDLDGDRVLTLVADVRDLDAMHAAVSRAIDRFGGIDVVVANAGIGSFGSVLHVDPDAFKTVIDVNLVGVFNTVRATLPSVIDRRGYILIVSSAAAFAATPGLAAYTATKAGVENLGSALHLEVAHLGVGVGTAHMTWVDTPLVREGQAEVRSFDRMIRSLPGPLRKIASVDRCAASFVGGIEGRKRRVYHPRWVGLLRWLKPVLSTPLAEKQLLKSAPGLVAEMDAEAAALGRSMSARTQALEEKQTK